MADLNTVGVASNGQITLTIAAVSIDCNITTRITEECTRIVCRTINIIEANRISCSCIAQEDSLSSPTCTTLP